MLCYRIPGLVVGNSAFCEHCSVVLQKKIQMNFSCTEKRNKIKISRNKIKNSSQVEPELLWFLEFMWSSDTCNAQYKIWGHTATDKINIVNNCLLLKQQEIEWLLEYSFKRIENLFKIPWLRKTQALWWNLLLLFCWMSHCKIPKYFCFYS